MSRSKMLSNSFSTGGGGAHFEAQVQASFVVLMLTGGHAPCLPCWPIVEIKLQGRIDGFETDDLIVSVENPIGKERRKLLGQVKHSIRITPSSAPFAEAIQAAWNDFNNSKVFARKKDAIALITGPLSKTDTDNAQWLLNHARHTGSVEEFFRHVREAKFSPSAGSDKLQIIQGHLKTANGDHDVSIEDLYQFLRHFHLLTYDFGEEGGVALSLLHSHISQFQQQDPRLVWSRIVDFTQTWNKDSGTITRGNIPDDIVDAFRQKAQTEMPEVLKAAPEEPRTDWTQHRDASCLALAVLLGSWQDKSQCDREATTGMLQISYDEWLKKAKEILYFHDSPLSINNGAWKVANRTELWCDLGSRILDQDLDRFRSLATSVLKEPDPAFELPAEERYAAGIHGKVPKHSHELRSGIAEGLAILGSRPEACRNCSKGKAEATSMLVVRELLTDADWTLWGSLNGLLPTLAEAAPGEFLANVEKAIRLQPCPFDELYSQEGSGITGSNYLTGLLWALEGLAWDEQYLVRVCTLLGELASHDPGGTWANRASNSLATILLPWLPQTLASIEKRKVAVQTLLSERPDAGWNLILQLLPGQHQTSHGSHKPKWRKRIPDDWREGVTPQHYWEQASFYAEVAVASATQDFTKLPALIDYFDNLPMPAFDSLLQVLVSPAVSTLPDAQRLPIWKHLSKFANKHRRFSDAKWALPDELITRIELAAEQLAPTDVFYLHQPLFAERASELCERSGSWKEQQKRLDMRREMAISEVLNEYGTEGVIRFAGSVSSPRQVGHALGAIAGSGIDQALLPSLLDSTDPKHRALVNGFVLRRCDIKGWKWPDDIDRSGWTPEQAGQFLACLPFAKEAWDRASKWLHEHEGEYWTRTDANPYQPDGDIVIAIDKLIQHRRPRAAINCLNVMLDSKQPIDNSQCVRALLAALSSSEPGYAMDADHIIELIKFLQADPSVDQDELSKVEWAYLPWLDRYTGGAPQFLESRLANDPEFFCEVIQLTYRSKNKAQHSREHDDQSRTVATNAWRLLHGWRTPPGTQSDGSFSDECFAKWLQSVKKTCTVSGHLEVALITIGEVLTKAPPDPDGLWIRRAVAYALNDREADDMRAGFRTATFNSRGAHYIDPTGKPERVLAEHFRSRADEIENAGFQRFAGTLRDLAAGYEREAERIVSEHAPENPTG